MTDNEAINMVDDAIKSDFIRKCKVGYNLAEALGIVMRIATNAIKNNNPYNSQGDLISRGDAINLLNEAQVEYDEYYKGLGKAKTIIDSAPTVETYTKDDMTQEYLKGYNACKDMNERPQGEWIPCTKSGMPLTEQGRLSGEKWYGFKCSNPECNYIYKGNALTESPFCQKCGADMRKGGAKPTKEVIDKLGECKCNTCKNNGTWVCVNKCRCFDKYVGGAE